MDDRAIHLCDDWIHIQLPDWETIVAAQDTLSTNEYWTEIVPGIDSIAIQFDPAIQSPDEAAKMVSGQMSSLNTVAASSRPTVTIPVCYEPEFAPDRNHIADKLAIAPEAMPSWHTSQMHRVSMLGFMPGFAYLMSIDDVPAIGRLDSPRQLVAAGSIGVIGQQSCIYSFDSPGGWPIIGRTPLRLFDPSRNQPATLSAGQNIRFESISREAFDKWQAEADA